MWQSAQPTDANVDWPLRIAVVSSALSAGISPSLASSTRVVGRGCDAM